MSSPQVPLFVATTPEIGDYEHATPILPEDCGFEADALENASAINIHVDNLVLDII